MSKVVLDSSALLAFLLDEPGAKVVELALQEGAFMSTINLAEVLSKAADVGENPEEYHSRLKREGILGGSIELISFAESDAVLLAKLRTETKSLGLSLGDRACLALGVQLKLPVITADKAWSKLHPGIKIKSIR